MKGIASMADVVAIERSHPQLPTSTYDMIRAAAAAHAKAPALSFFLHAKDHTRPTTWSYESLFARITATANFFHDLGVCKNDVVAFLLPNLPETHLTLWGGEATGIVLAINPLLEPAAVAQLLRAGEAKVLVTMAPFPGAYLWSKVQTILGDVPSLRHLVLIDIAHYLGGVEAARGGFQPGMLRGISPGIAVHDFAGSIDRQPTARLVSRRVIEPGDLSSFFCTGGTTGAPKIAMRTHANEVVNAWSTAQFLGDGIDASKTIFCGLPLFHVNAVQVTGLLPFSRGAHVILGTAQGYRGEGVVPRFWEIVERHRINFFSGVPTLYAGLLHQPAEGYDLSSLEYGLCGAAPMPIELMRSFQDRTGLKILEGYGLTEGTCVSSVNPPRGERRVGSIGLRLPLQQMKAVILDDAGTYVRDCAVGEVGVLVIRGPNVFAGYKVAEHNNALWVDAGTGGRWLNTGDLGRQDGEGYFYLTGRKKELIIRGGHNIDPATIEEPLHKHPAVHLVAAVGRPDAHAGEVVVAYVSLKPDATATEAELLSFAHDHVTERAALPKRIRIIDEMPLSAVGKIFKPDLKHREIQDALSSALREAGVRTESVTSGSDPTHGTIVDVMLAEGTDAELARRVLGRFPFRCRVSSPFQSSSMRNADREERPGCARLAWAQPT
ncbi:MAG TPA: acyl-CoA synthetase [Burkholderiaceae bacterium]|nr:acyl-CoA synthetase [Burkholderiaceae bacterium]